MICKNCGALNSITPENLPEQYKPLGAWAYFGYSLLFSIPVVGLVLLIVFSFNHGNINRRNFARSYFCAYIILAVVIAIYAILAFALGFGFSAFYNS